MNDAGTPGPPGTAGGSASPRIHRSTIAKILREVADLLELDGENPFRCRAYANGARAIEGMAEDPQDLYEAGTLGEVKGIGPGLVSGIAEILLSGSLGLHTELSAKFPPGIQDLLRLPGLGPKRLRVLIRELGIDSTSALEKACHEGRVAPASARKARRSSCRASRASSASASAISSPRRALRPRRSSSTCGRTPRSAKSRSREACAARRRPSAISTSSRSSLRQTVKPSSITSCRRLPCCS
jgi:hypothetical protein